MQASSNDEISPAARLALQIEEYILKHPTAAILEDGRVLFDMRSARYSTKDAHGRCLLELWSEERNLVRTVVEVQQRVASLRLMTRRMGATKPQALELVASSDRRTPTTRDAARRNYQRLLERALTRHFIGAKVDGLRSAMDLEHSFGPAYIRGRLFKGTAADAVIGVAECESGAMVDGILTLGVLWLHYCREHADLRRHFGGLKVIVPVGAWRTTAERMAWLNHAAANFELYTLDERSEDLAEVDINDTGNLESRLMHAFSSAAAIERCKTGIDRLMELVPASAQRRVELRAGTPAEVGLMLHGLEFARVRHGAAAHSFTNKDEATFGAGANETPLTDDNQEACRELFARLFLSRHASGAHNDALFRMQPERWLESQLRMGIGKLLPEIRGEAVYSQVPAISSGDRGMLDLLALDRRSRLAVIEIKADEDLHLPMQALDYWIRVRALNADRQTPAGGMRSLSAFERAGYFPGAEISELDPRLVLFGPALRIHANEPVLRYFSPKIQWELIALNEDWRRELNIVFRKRSG